MRERERYTQSMSRGGADTESEEDFRLRAVSTEPDAGLELTNLSSINWQRQHEWGRGRERWRETISSKLCAASAGPNLRLELKKL